MKQDASQPIRFGYPLHLGLTDPEKDTLPLKDRVAGKILAAQAKVVPDRPFLCYEKKWITYSEADKRANKTANMLANLGIKKGDKVAIAIKNCPEYLDLWFALTRIGGIQVPLNLDYRSPQIKYVFERSKIDHLVVDTERLAEYRDVLQKTKIKTVIVLRGHHDGGSLNQGELDYRTRYETASDVYNSEWDQVSGADIGAVMNTSGTTGPSKGVLLTHAQQYILGRMIAADMALDKDDVYYNFFPLFHNTAQAMIAMPAIQVGGAMVLTEKFSASRFWSDIEENGCTAFYYIGEIIKILLKSSASVDGNQTSLQKGWGIGAAEKDFIEFQKRFNVALCTGYGSTEANVPCYLPHGSTKTGSAGVVAKGFEIRIADEDGAQLPPGKEGEILVRSYEPCALMAGYDGNHQETIKAWKDLWLHTGDAGRIDEEGYLYFSGRIKDAIRVRGENISAFEVESAMFSHPEIFEVAAIAVPSELGGDDLKIVVVLKSDSVMSPENLITHAERLLPKYSIPRYVEFVKELPKTPTNKIMKHVLRSNPFSAETWDRMTRTTLGKK